MKILRGGKLEHYNSIGGTTKKKWGRNFEISVGESKTGTRFLTQVHWGEDLGGKYDNLYQFWKYYEENNNQFSLVLIIVSLAKYAP